MNNDVLVLKLLSSKEAFDKYSDFVKIDYLDLEIREIFKALKLYMQFCDENPVDFNNFSTWFLQSYISDIKEDQAKIYKLIFEQIQRVEKIRVGVWLPHLCLSLVRNCLFLQLRAG